MPTLHEGSPFLPTVSKPCQVSRPSFRSTHWPEEITQTHFWPVERGAPIPSQTLPLSCGQVSEQLEEISGRWETLNLSLCSDSLESFFWGKEEEWARISGERVVTWHSSSKLEVPATRFFSGQTRFPSLRMKTPNLRWVGGLLPGPTDKSEGWMRGLGAGTANLFPLHI